MLAYPAQKHVGGEISEQPREALRSLILRSRCWVNCAYVVE